MKRTPDYNGCLEIDIALKLSQLEGCLKFLNHMHNHKQHRAPRNETERRSIITNLKRVQETRDMYRTLIRKHKIKAS